MRYRNAYWWAAVWILFCTWCQVVPWALSVAGQLNREGYFVAILLTLPAIWFCGRPFRRFTLASWKGWKRWRNRIQRQPVFGVYLFLLVAALVGGVIYPPTNHDGLTYRFPRVLHWFWEGQWHWITNPAEPQMNLSTHGFEWLTGFLFALTGTDRLFFLINLASFALVPGVLFAFLTRLGISGRVASWWMWIFPCGYGLALQAGSIGNDLFAVPYVLAGMVFALRARESRCMTDVTLAILAAALVTGTKLSNAPLVLPIAVALAGNLSWVARWRNAPALLGATIAGVIASAAPVMIACTLETGHFSGDPENSKNLNVGNPAAGLVANSLQVVSRNLMPPVNPVAGWWNSHYRDWIPESVTALLQEGYPRFHLNSVELPQEEGDGMGLGITFLLILGLGAGIVSILLGHRSRRTDSRFGLNSAIYLAVGAAGLVYFGKMGSEAAPRLLLPYYSVLLILVLGFEANRRMVRRRWWRVTAMAAACFVLPAVILSPNRPLFPVRAILSQLPESIREKGSVKRVATVYETYADRHDAMAPLRKWLPESGPIAFVGDGRSLRTGLWRPFGSRKIETVSLEREDLKFAVGEFSAVVIDLSRFGPDSVENWARSRGLRIVGTEPVSNYAGKAPERYAVLVPNHGNLTSAGLKR